MKIETVDFDTVHISKVSMKGSIKTIYPSPITFSVCPFCGEEVVNYVSAIRVSSTDCVKLYGLACYKCSAFFSDKPDLIGILDKNRIDKSSLRVCWDFSFSHDDVYSASVISKFGSAIYQITACAPGKLRTFTIVTSKRDSDSVKDIFHYTDRAALELITAVMMNERKIKVGSDNLVIEKIHKVDSGRREDAFHTLSPFCYMEVMISKNGGYYDRDTDIIHIDGLVFCENSKCLEVMPMSYSVSMGIYFVDSRVYNQFRKSHGYPIVQYVSRSKDGFRELRDESLLHCLGYNVGFTDGLSDAERHKMLASFVDIGFFEIHSIVNHLTFLINLNGKTRIGACEKWNNDIEFISNYRIDSERFAFVSRIKSKWR